jgi:predicted aspartyl protease
MIEGRVVGGIPLVTVTINGVNWNAILDTGFNGDLELPVSLANSLNPRYFGRGKSILAGGQSVEEDHFFVDFPFAGETLEALATFVEGSEILIGTGLLANRRLEVDFRSSTVTLD